MLIQDPKDHMPISPIVIITRFFIRHDFALQEKSEIATEGCYSTIDRAMECCSIANFLRNYLSVANIRIATEIVSDSKSVGILLPIFLRKTHS